MARSTGSTDWIFPDVSPAQAANDPTSAITSANPTIFFMSTSPPRRVAPAAYATLGPTGGSSKSREIDDRDAPCPRGERRRCGGMVAWWGDLPHGPTAGRRPPFVIHRTRDAVGRARQAGALVPAHPRGRVVLVHVAPDQAVARVVRGGPARPRGHLRPRGRRDDRRSEEHTSELQSPCNLVCRLLLEKKN